VAELVLRGRLFKGCNNRLSTMKPRVGRVLGSQDEIMGAPYESDSQNGDQEGPIPNRITSLR